MADVHMVARDQLRSFIERIERLEAEKQTIADDIKDVYGEAKGTGFDTKILRKVISIRKMDRDERAEQEAILDTYLAALGMIPQPDLFDDEPHDAETGELSPKLAHTIVTGLQTETGRAALVAAVDIMIEQEEAQADETLCEYCNGSGDVHRIDGEWLGRCHCEAGRYESDPATEIASASQGEAEDHSDQRETDREAAADEDCAGANAGGDDVESSAERAGPVDPINLEPSGPEAERATNSPEAASETPKQVYGDSVEDATAPPSQSVDIPAGGESAPEIDGSKEECPADPNSPEEAPKFLTKAEEGAEAKGTATVDPVSRAEAETDRQRSSEAGPTDGRRQGGVEPSAAAVAPASSFLTKPPSPLRPNCQRPENCGGYGRTHCGTCLRANEREFA